MTTASESLTRLKTWIDQTILGRLRGSDLALGVAAHLPTDLPEWYEIVVRHERIRSISSATI